MIKYELLQSLGECSFLLNCSAFLLFCELVRSFALSPILLIEWRRCKGQTKKFQSSFSLFHSLREPPWERISHLFQIALHNGHSRNLRASWVPIYKLLNMQFNFTCYVANSDLTIAKDLKRLARRLRRRKRSHKIFYLKSFQTNVHNMERPH